jgi:hypothetical protein
LARFPRSVLKVKVQGLLADHAYACLLNGQPAQSFKPDGWWFRRWEESYGLSMRKANRKYAVPRKVVKERLEIFWVSLFRIRYFIFLVFGYDPLIQNWDQSPFHHNESGSQDKPTLGVRGSTVPVVEGNVDTKSRWTANLMTSSRFTAVAGGEMNPAECMFKAAPNETVHKRLQEFLRSRGFPKWFTVTVAPKGSYCEQDVIEFLKRHLEEWKEGRDWRIVLGDDMAAHKTDNVWNLCWVRGYVLIIHGGGTTPFEQTPDTDLNEHVRREYGGKEAHLLMEKMRAGENVPKLEREECMLLMWQVLSDPKLHEQAAKGYKSVGQSVALHGQEDALICREAGIFWREKTTDNYLTMRPKINDELTAVAEEVKSGGLPWTLKDVKRLIKPYPKNKKVDKILANLGEDFYHDDLQNLDGAGDDDIKGEDDEGDGGSGSEVAEENQEEPYSSSDEDHEEDKSGHVDAAVAGDCENTCGVEHESLGVPLSAAQADSVHQTHGTIATLEASIDNLKATGAVRAIQGLERELQNQRRKERELIREAPAVADAFLRLRRAEEQEALKQKHIMGQLRERKREAAKAIEDKKSACEA